MKNLVKNSQANFLIALLFSFFLFTNTQAQDWSQMNKIVAGDRTLGDSFGTVVAISGDYAIISSFNYGNTDVDSPGAAYVFKRNGSSWTEVAKLTAPIPQENGGFASAVAISGDYAIVGAQYEDLDGTPVTEDAGAAYIYKKDQDGTDKWGLIAALTVPGGLPEYTFYGSAVAISGNYAIVGARGDYLDEAGENEKADAGAAYVFERNTSTDKWEFKRKITASTRQARASFGNAVAIEGDYAVVGAPGENSLSPVLVKAGAAYIFGKNNSNWGLVTKLTPSAPFLNGQFGVSVSIDGDLVAIGAPRENEFSGGAYIFQQDNTDPNIWTQKTRITPGVVEEGDNFGISVSISGNNLIAGAFNNGYDEGEENWLSSAGAAYIFNKNHLTADSWGQVKKLVASDRAEGDMFGLAVAISGNYAIIGSPADSEDADGNNTVAAAGSSYIFGNLTALPVTLTNFEVSKEENSATIHWKTANETNTDYFEVQKSADARNWKVIGSIEAAGESSQSITYSLDDAHPFKGQNLYRLKMVDLDGTFAYSRIKSINFNKSDSDFIYPNPVSDHVFIALDPEKVASIQLVNLYGRVVLNTSKITRDGISLSHVTPGLYSVKLTRMDGSVQLDKLVVSR